MGKHTAKLFLIIILSIGISHADDDHDNRLNRLGEIEDCPRGCECITDSARGKIDKSGIVKAIENEAPVDSNGPSGTESK